MVRNAEGWERVCAWGELSPIELIKLSGSFRSPAADGGTYPCMDRGSVRSRLFERGFQGVREETGSAGKPP